MKVTLKRKKEPISNVLHEITAVVRVEQNGYAFKLEQEFGPVLEFPSGYFEIVEIVEEM